MGDLQASLADKIGRHWAPGRILAFVLLGFALLGYAGLPSNPPTSPLHFRTASIVQMHPGALPEGLLVPTQAKEHRSRDTLAEPATDQPDDRLPITLQWQGVEVALPFRHASAAVESRAESPPGPARAYSSRAPPALQMI